MSFTRSLAYVFAVAVYSSAQAGTIYVDVTNCPGPGDGSELDPYCSLQTAIDNAGLEGDEIVVAPGTYFETIDFIGKAVWLHSSDGPEVTVISANGPDGADSAVTCASGEGDDTILEGFTLTDGTGTTVVFLGSAFEAGGGMVNMDDSNPTVTNCTFTGNSADSGGGMYNQNESSPTVTNCTFTENSSSGMVNNNSNPTVTNCTFSGNTATNGGGMSNVFNSSPTVANCTFSGNSATNDGGGMRNNNGNPMVANCTFSGNTAATGGAMLNVFNSTVTLTNCILWGDSPNEIVEAADPITNVLYSDVQGGWSGIGNIDADPSFVDPDNGDFRLSPGSPCIDAGNNWGVAGLMETDLDGNPRFMADGNDFDPGCGEPVVVDIGAYEFPGTPFDVVFGDLNGNGTVGVVDLMILNECLGSDDPDCCIADLNMDGVIGIIDQLFMGSAMVEFVPVTAVP